MREKRWLTCGTCAGKRQLWLGGGDYLECPLCDGAGGTEVIAERVQARVQERYIPSFAGGYIKQSAVLVPRHGWETHGSVPAGA